MNNNNMITKENLVNLLKENVVVLKYKKADGTIREMNCTKSMKLLDSEVGREILKHVMPRLRHDVPAHLMSVWDIDNEGYRRIIPGNILEIDSVMPVNEYEEMLRKEPNK